MTEPTAWNEFGQFGYLGNRNATEEGLKVTRVFRRHLGSE
jgi:hypothetical protein